jgi:hypothetical protein
VPVLNIFNKCRIFFFFSEGPQQDAESLGAILKSAVYARKTLLEVISEDSWTDEEEEDSKTTTPVVIPNLFYVCPLCGGQYDVKSGLKLHLVQAHFRVDLEAAIPAATAPPPYSCPRPRCGFSAAERKQIADHLGRQHETVLLWLVNQTVPQFGFVPQFLCQSLGKTVGAVDLSDVYITDDDEIEFIG